MATTLATADEWVSPQQLAAELGRPLSTIYKWHHYGRGPKRFRLGNRVAYRRQDVNDWLESLAVQD